MGTKVAKMGSKPNTRLEGPSKSCIYLNNKPTNIPINILKPIVTDRSGPKTKDIATNTNAAVVNGLNTFFQNDIK